MNWKHCQHQVHHKGIDNSMINKLSGVIQRNLSVVWRKMAYAVQKSWAAPNYGGCYSIPKRLVGSSPTTSE